MVRQMRSNVPRPFLVAAVLASSLLCNPCTVEGVDTAPRRGTVEGLAKDSGAAPVPVLLVRDKEDRPPTSVELAEILRAAEPSIGKGGKLWFVLVQYNLGDTCWATVCLEPDERGPRLRKGRWVSVSLSKGRVFDDTPRARAVGVRRYVQISMKEQPFTDVLHLPTRDTLPFWYFPKKTGIDGDELVRLVDYARPAFRDLVREDPELTYLSFDQPLCVVVRDQGDKDLFKVTVGVLELGGGWIMVRRVGGEFELVRGEDGVETGHWSHSLRDVRE